jgi:acyl-CoA thioesterase YciA
LPNNPATKADEPPDGKPTLCNIAMPMDTNPHGDIFGGWLVSQMAARRRRVARKDGWLPSQSPA